MKSIVKYLQEDDCIFKYDKEDSKKILNEEVLTLYLFTTLIMSCLLIIIKIVNYIIGSIYFHVEIKKAKELDEYSKKLSEILKDDIKCYMIVDVEPNAFNAGGKNCYMTNSLFAMLNDKERTAIFLHEYGHYKAKHIFKLFGFETTVGVLAVATLNTVLSFMGVNSILFILVYISMIISKLFGNNLSRSFEYDADKFAAEYGYQKELVTGLKKIERWVRDNLCKQLKKDECDQAIEALHDNSTHPSFKERFEKILKTPTIRKFVLAMSINPTENLYTTIKLYLKKKWTDIFGQEEVLK